MDTAADAARSSDSSEGCSVGVTQAEAAVSRVEASGTQAAAVAVDASVVVVYSIAAAVDSAVDRTAVDRTVAAAEQAVVRAVVDTAPAMLHTAAAAEAVDKGIVAVFSENYSAAAAAAAEDLVAEALTLDALDIQGPTLAELSAELLQADAARAADLADLADAAVVVSGALDAAWRGKPVAWFARSAVCCTDDAVAVVVLAAVVDIEACSVAAKEICQVSATRDTQAVIFTTQVSRRATASTTQASAVVPVIQEAWQLDMAAVEPVASSATAVDAMEAETSATDMPPMVASAKPPVMALSTIALALAVQHATPVSRLLLTTQTLEQAATLLRTTLTNQR